MIYRFLTFFFIFSISSAMHKQDINFADVTLEGLNNFAYQHSLMSLTDSSYVTLRTRLQELGVSKTSDELIAIQFYCAERIKESRRIKRVLTLVNMRMKGIASPCLPHIPNVTNLEQTGLPRSNCTFIIPAES